MLATGVRLGMWVPRPVVPSGGTLRVFNSWLLRWEWCMFPKLATGEGGSGVSEVSEGLSTSG